MCPPTHHAVVIQKLSHPCLSSLLLQIFLRQHQHTTNGESNEENHLEADKTSLHGTNKKLSTCTNYWLRNTTNQYNVLSDDSNEVAEVDASVKINEPKFPNKFITGVQTIKALTNLLEEIAKRE